MQINATDIRIGEPGLLTHQPITICQNGVLVKYQDAKPRNITLNISDTMCLINEDDKLKYIITAPFKIKIDKGIE